MAINSVEASISTTQQDPAAMALALASFWHRRWGACERLSDIEMSPDELAAWNDYLVTFEVLDGGFDFRAALHGHRLTPIFGRDCSGAVLSRFPSPHGRGLRRLLVRSILSRRPVIEHYSWLTESFLGACITCVIPIAGGHLQATRLAAGIFYAIGQARPEPEKVLASMVATDHPKLSRGVSG